MKHADARHRFSPGSGENGSVPEQNFSCAISDFGKPQDADMTVRFYEETASVAAAPAAVFAYLDDPAHLTAHMGKSSWMMGGGRMDVSVDEGGGQKVGSHIRLDGMAFGLRVYLDEVVAKRQPPSEKQWETVGAPRLFVIGGYTMGFKLEPLGPHSRLRIFIHYHLPPDHAWLGTLFADMYAKWCVGAMLRDTRLHFAVPPKAKP